MSYEIRQIPVTKTTLDGTELFEGQSPLGGPGSSFQSPVASLSNIALPRVDHAASAAIISADMDAVHTNKTATGVIVLTLPPALIGTGGMFVADQYDMELQPTGSDTIATGGAGKKLVIKAGGLISIECFLDAGRYSIVNDSAAWSVYP